MSRKFLIVGVVFLVSLAAVASAVAGGSISSVSKTGKVSSQETKALTAKCHGDSQAVAGGYKGVLRGNFNDGLTALYPLQSRLDGPKATAAEVNVSTTSGKVSATSYGYCGSPPVSESQKTVRVVGGQVGYATAKCSGDRTPISGGFKGSFSFTHASGTIATSSQRSSGGWKVGGISVSSMSSGRVPITAYAYCAKDVGQLKARSKKVTLRATGPMGNIHATNIDVSCDPGERVVSGGFRPALAASQSNGPITVSSYRKSADTWRVSSAVSSQNARIIAYAYCRDK